MKLRVSLFRYKSELARGGKERGRLTEHSNVGCTVNGINGVGMISVAMAESDLITKYVFAVRCGIIVT